MRSKLISIFAFSICLYATKLTEISPIYIIYSIGAVISSIILLITKVRFQRDVIIAVLLLVYVTFRYSLNGTWINLEIGILSYVFIRLSSKLFGADQWWKIFYGSTKFSVALLFIDSAYRVLNPTHPNAEQIERLAGTSQEFYLYKFNSVMFADSNTTALILVIFLFGLLQYKERVSKSFIGLLFLLVMGTFSRSAYVAVAIGMMFNKLSRKVARSLFVVIVIILLLGLSIFITKYNDGSLSSKFFLLKLILDSVKSFRLESVLFGLGPGAGETYLSVFPHIMPLTYLIDLGLLGLLFISILFYYWSRERPTLTLPIILMSFSYFLYLGTPFLFVPMSIFMNISDHEK